MNITEIVEKVAEKQGSPSDLAWGFVQDTIKAIAEVLDQGEEVRVRGLGTFRWERVAERPPIRSPHGTNKQPAGWKLKFTPAYKLRSRRTSWARKKTTKKA
jgi:nucleoid DNA-binding protein